MKTISHKDGTVETTISGRSTSMLLYVIESLSSSVKMPAPTENSSEHLWHRLVSQVCVMGGARGIEKLVRAGNKKRLDAFTAATSLQKWSESGFDEGYMSDALREASACRFPAKTVKKLREMAGTRQIVQGTRVVLLEGLSTSMPREKLRSELMTRCPLFGLKSVSDFMISTHLSQDVIALDTRLVGIFRDHLSYPLTAAQVQADDAVYLSVESSLRIVCEMAGITLAHLDRLLFQLSGVSVVEFFLKKAPDRLPMCQ
jgi:thermostable 8-oxoguanine DNA glycosylase